MTLDSKTGSIGAVLAAVAVAIGIAAGKLVWETPEGRECAIELAATEVRVELLTEARDRCEDAIDAMEGRSE